jgi:iron complex outermembrane receptor protein
MKRNTAVIKTLPTGSLMALAVSLAIPVAAQDSPGLEEIVVTAEHREVSLQDTQISITAFNATAIQELGISNGLDIFGHAPNVNVQPYQGGRNGLSFSIRGIVNAETLITFDPGVSVYVDNVLLAKNVGAQLDVAELERIEILRGPQGTLYGRNTMGGAVNYITKKPGNEFEGSLMATVGNYDRWNIRGTVNVPLLGSDSGAGELNMRLSAATINRDGIQDNDLKAPGVTDEFGTEDRNVGLLHLQWRPTEDLSVLYSYDITRIDEVPVVPWATVSNNNGAGPLFAPFLEPKESDYPESGLFDAPENTAETDVDGHALNISWNLSDTLTLQSISGYREMENYGAAGTDGTPIPALVTGDLQELESFSQEFRLVGSALDGQIEYTTGVFYWDEEGDVYNTVTAFGNPSSSNSIAKYSNESWAVYGQASYYLTEKWSLTGGLRYTQEDREMNKANIGASSFDKPIFYDDYVKLPGVEDTLFPKASDDYDNVSWLVSVSYDWNEDVMTYAKVSTGFQSGGFNVRDTRPDAFTDGFDEETLTSYEVGLKSEWGGRFIVNAAAFFSDYEDKQVNVFDPESLGNVRQNADVEIWGVELEVLAQLTDHWQLGFGYGYLDKEFTKFDDLQGNDVSDTTNFTYAPDNTANGHLAYEHPMGSGVFKARVDWSYRDEMNFLAPAPEPNSSDDFHLFNARISWAEIEGPGDTTMRVSLWGKNLTDEGYWTSGVNILPTLGLAFNLWGEPRTYGADFEILF